MAVALPPTKLSALAMDLGMLPRESDNVLAKDNRLASPASPLTLVVHSSTLWYAWRRPERTQACKAGSGSVLLSRAHGRVERMKALADATPLFSPRAGVGTVSRVHYRAVRAPSRKGRFNAWRATLSAWTATRLSPRRTVSIRQAHHGGHEDRVPGSGARTPPLGP